MEGLSVLHHCILLINLSDPPYPKAESRLMTQDVCQQHLRTPLDRQPMHIPVHHSTLEVMHMSESEPG